MCGKVYESVCGWVRRFLFWTLQCYPQRGLFSAETDDASSVWTQTLTVALENVTQHIPVEVLGTVLSCDERSDWDREDEVSKRHEDEPLSEDEESRLLACLQNGRRTVHWLHNFNRRPPASFADTVVDALE